MKEIADRGLRIADLQSQPAVTPNEALPNARAPKPPVDSVNPQSAIRNSQFIELRIEELVIDGFAPDNRDRFVAAVENELARLLGERGIPGSLTEDVEIEYLTGGALRIRQDEESETTGRHLAQAIYARIAGGPG